MAPNFDSLYAPVAEFYDAGEEYERIIRRVYEVVLAPGDFAIDVGAHLGKHTLPMALTVGPTGHVLGLEPIPWAYERLVRRVKGAGLADVVTVRHACVADVKGEVTFSIVPSHPGWSSLAPRAEVHDVELVNIEQTTLDLECASDRPVRFIKIDVEGAEALVIDGAANVITRDLPVVHIEVVPEALSAFGSSVAAVAEPLRSRGYRLFDLLGNDVTDDATWESSAAALGITDYIAIQPNDRAFDAVQRVFAAAFSSERATSAIARGSIALGKSPTLTDGRTGRVRPLTSPTLAATPVSIAATQMKTGHVVNLELSFDAFSTGHHQTVIELYWPATKTTTLVRLLADTRMQLLWLDSNGEKIQAHAANPELTAGKLRCEIRGSDERVNVDVRMGTAFVSTALDRATLGDAVFVGEIGQRAHHTNPEALPLESVSLSATVRIPTLKQRARKVAGRVKRSLTNRKPA